MGVQQRIALARGPVVEPDRQHPLAGHVLDTAMATAGAQMLVQVAERLGQPGVMGGQHGPADCWVTQAVEDRDTFGRPQDHIERGHGVAAMRPAEQLTSCRVPTFEHGPWNPAGDASPSSPKPLAPAPYHRPGDSPWPDRYCSWSVASSRV